MADEIPPLPPGAPNSPPPPPPDAIKAAPMNVPPIPLEGVSSRKATLPVPPTAQKPEHEIKDSFRELIETVVFVVVLVLMLKTFLAEAFVIPTGSMADTLLGYHYKVKCTQCEYVNWVNATHEAEPPPGVRDPRVERCQCSNCKFIIELPHSQRARGPQP